MHIVRENSAKKSIYINILIFAIILCIYPLYTTAEIRTFSHEEINDYGSTAIPHVWDTKIYDDNTIVARIVRVNTTTENTTCFYEMFSLRIIHPDGAVDEKDIELDIPQFNYCIPSMLSPLGMKNGKPVLFLDFLDYHLIRKNHILITYYNKATPYEEWGMVIDLDGNVLDRTPFGFVYSDSDDIFELMPNSKIKLNINREKGFLRLADPADASKPLEWQQYRIEPNGKFTKLTTGILEFALSSLNSTIMSTVDENYAIVYVDLNPLENPLSLQDQLFVLPIGYSQQSTSPLLLYQSPFSITGLSCDIAFIEVGHVCILAVHDTFYVKINFLSSGSVTNFTVINLDEIKIDGNEEIDGGFLDGAWIVNNLPFGGYLITRYYFTVNISSFRIFNPIHIYGYLFGDNDTSYTKWEFDEPIKETYGVFQVLRNYTLLVAQIESNNSWQFRVTDLPKFTANKDKGYFNPNIEATIPKIQSSINPNILKISVDFYNPVELSSGNLSIYQMVGRKQYLRQSIPGNICSIGNGGKTISANVLESTFSVSKGNYFIEMDNNFVRHKALNEPSSGIRENIWLFNAEEKKDTFTPSATGLLRLTPEGTQKFDKFSWNERLGFFDNLLKELALAIPVSLSRLTTVERTQLDNRSSEKRYLISIRINETRDEHDNSVESIFRIIDTMVKYKDQTPIGPGNVTSYLDESYGFIRLPNLWETYKFNLMGLFIFVGLLIGLFILAGAKTYLQKKDSLKKKDKTERGKKGEEDSLKKKYNNFAILQFGVIICDLIIDFLFVTTNSKDIYVLYIPSIVFLTLPIAINSILAFNIITQENTNPKFYQWFIMNGNVASILTALACTDITALNISKSNLAEYKSFDAPFSGLAKSKIIWGNLLNIFVVDIPQLIIQVYYRHNAVFYDIVPFLALISSSVNLAIHMVGILYETTHRVTIPRYILNIPSGGDKDDDKLPEEA